jgi:hypothetical protein
MNCDTPCGVQIALALLFLFWQGLQATFVKFFRFPCLLKPNPPALNSSSPWPTVLLEVMAGSNACSFRCGRLLWAMRLIEVRHPVGEGRNQSKV